LRLWIFSVFLLIFLLHLLILMIVKTKKWIYGFAKA
jgi:hypothetical protein